MAPERGGTATNFLCYYTMPSIVRVMSMCEVQLDSIYYGLGLPALRSQWSISCGTAIARRKAGLLVTRLSNRTLGAI